MEHIFSGKIFSYEDSEESHQQLWRVLVNSLEEFDSESVSQIIRYTVTTISRYSVLEFPDFGIGLRHITMPYTLLKLLDTGGWRDTRGRHRDNSDGNVMEIADWIFGTGEHEGEGILTALTNPSRGVLGWHDIMTFRLNCCVDRNSTFFSLQRALTRDSEPEAPVTGVTTSIVVAEMRKLSQAIFQIFKWQFIIPKRNILRDISALSLDDLTGDFIRHVRNELEAGHGDIQKLELAADCCRTVIAAFIIYQLSNRRISSGIGCGFYDEVGNADRAGIFNRMNDYLFDVCFAPSDHNDGYEVFFRHLLNQFDLVLDGADGRTRLPRIDHITAVLDQERLRAYWREHRADFIKAKFEDRLEFAINPNYKMPYSEGVPLLIQELDTLLAN